MKYARILGAVAVLGLVITGSVYAWNARQAEGDTPGLIMTPGMHYSVAYDPYDPNPVTKSGGTMLAPPKGTVPYKGPALLYEAGEGEGRRAGDELKNEAPDTPDTVRLGQEVFQTFCLACHGTMGRGDGPVVGTGRFANPTSLLSSKARARKDGELFHIITFGRGAMPSYRVQVTPLERWQAVRYVRSLQDANPMAAGASP